jgi:hypothetical protein
MCATAHAAELAAMGATELAAMGTAELAAMGTTELAAMSAAKLATAHAAMLATGAAHDTILDTAHHFQNLKHFTTSWSMLQNPRQWEAGPQRTSGVCIWSTRSQRTPLDDCLTA